MGFIVSAVIVNEASQVLMIQEAKYSCHGTWYLPAGRVEKKESLVVCFSYSNSICMIYISTKKMCIPFIVMTIYLPISF